MMKKEKEFNDKDVKKILDDFGATSEEDLVDIVEKTWNLVTCEVCNNQFDLTLCHYSGDGDPICPRCHHG